MTQAVQTIHVLSPQVANQIAAGEVVERPSSVVKELVENSLDAGATQVIVRITQAGKKRIEIEDNGAGMSAEDAELALQRHATSKISLAEDLMAIASHGFRGEALPSIASVSRFRMHTALADAAEGVEVRVDGGGATDVRPAAPRKGTRIEVLDLFLNTPARLHFMRTDKTEEAAIVEVVRQLALANPDTGLRLELDGRERLSFQAGQDAPERVQAVLGKDFASNSLVQHIEHESMQITGHLGLPTFHHRDASRMLFMINGRTIRDKQLIAALRAGYRDVMFHDRYPVALVRIEMDPAFVDVNVHPAKLEVRFRSPQSVRAGVVACVRAGIERMGQQVASTTTAQALQSMQRTTSYPSFQSPGGYSYTPAQGGGGHASMPVASRSAGQAPADIQRLLFQAPQGMDMEVQEPSAGYGEGPLELGKPLAQIHRCYILTQTDSGIILVDQHAAHERITYEKLKKQLAMGELASQMMLTPERLPVDVHIEAWLAEHAESLHAFGVELDQAGEELYSIRSVPALLSGESPVPLVQELIDACMLIGVEAEGRGRVLERWLGNRACKGSIKAGFSMSPEAQEALLREMERTPNIAQCNHGRPTYVRLSLNELDRLFGRKE